MTDLRAAVDAYLTLRRSLGYTLIDAGWLLPDFIDYLHRHSAEHVTTELALAWATLPVNTSPVWWRQRLSAVRGFTEYLRNIDPDTQVPPRDLLPAHQQRIAPYLYSDIDLEALMAAARSLNPPLRAATYEIFIGFLSVTGLRLGEALALDRDDLDSDRKLLRVRRAKRGGRLVPVHETTIHSLHGYIRSVNQHFPRPVSPSLFVSTRGTRLNRNSLHTTFPMLIDQAGLAGRGQRPRPRIHDLRHTFAVRQLIDWYHQGVDIEARIPALTSVLGHSDPASTYWYMHESPELFTIVAQRLENVEGERK